MKKEIITKDEAIERGLKRFFTGKQCKEGHFADRFIANGVCSECAKVQQKQKVSKKKTKSKLRNTALQLIADGDSGKLPTVLDPQDLSQALDVVINEVVPEVHAVISKVVDQAKNGCTKSQKLILARVWPESKGMGTGSGTSTVSVNINVVDNNKDALNAVNVPDVNIIDGDV